MVDVGPNRSLIFGVDEAGYGPNIGPLVISCSIWSIPDSLSPVELLDKLYPEFQPKFDPKAARWLPLGDSKRIYPGNQSIDGLALGINALLTLGGNSHDSLDDVVRTSVHTLELDRLRKIPWYAGRWDSEPVNLHRYSCPNDPHTIPSLSGQLDFNVPVHLIELARKKLEYLGVEFGGMRSAIVDETEFNRRLQGFENKATILSLASLDLVARCVKEFVSEIHGRPKSIEVYCDKHGGRNRYHAPLAQVFPELWFQAEVESMACSRYRSEWEAIPMRWSFLAKGDSLAPSAAASMIAKLTRELLVSDLNRFWRSHLPDLRPTAGYPVDALRFANEISTKAMELGFTRDQWWRMK